MSFGHRSTHVRLGDLSDLGVPATWHEAVAVVRVVAQLVLMDPHAEPDAAHILLREDGALEIESKARGRPAPADAATGALTWPPTDDDMDDVLAVHVEGDGALTPLRRTPGGLVRSLAALLSSLLPASAPDGLQALADPERIDLHAARVDTFLDAISFFARPDDDLQLRGLAIRAMAASEAAGRAAALRDLTERARTALPAQAAPAPIVPDRRRWTAFVVAAAIVTAATVGAAGWWLTRARVTTPGTMAPSARAAAPTATARQSVPDAPPVRRRPPTGTPRSGRPAGSHELPAPTDTQSRGPGLADSGAPAGSAVAPADEPVGAEEREASPAPLEEAPAIDTANEPGRIYDAGDPEVAPPTPVRAQMPAQPLTGVPIEQMGTLELTIDEQGGVLSARLVPTSRRLQDRVMVSAAKAWRFTPARRRGEAVRYRLRMPITW